MSRFSMGEEANKVSLVLEQLVLNPPKWGQEYSAFLAYLKILSGIVGCDLVAKSYNT
jgi:hypothetical protein